MENQYMSQKEYKNYEESFYLMGVRSQIVTDLKPYLSGIVLDVPTGHGYFAVEASKFSQYVIGVDLLEHDVKAAKKVSAERGNIGLARMDAVNLGFPSNIFDAVINFLGLEDICMTRGKEGVEKALSEMSRVSKNIVAIAVQTYGEEPDEILAQEIAAYIGHNAVFYPVEFYAAELEKNGLKIVEKKVYYTTRKLNTGQAKAEIKFACEYTPLYFGVSCRPFDEVWAKFSERIEQHGVALYSDICMIVGQK